jgi:hypothetical protein
MEQVKRSMVDAFEGLIENLAEYEKTINEALSMQKEITAKHDAYDTAVVRRAIGAPQSQLSSVGQTLEN